MAEMNGIDTIAQQAAERDLAHKLCMAVLYRFVLAAGGAAHFRVTDLPPEIPMHFRIANGIATLTAMAPKLHNGLVKAPAGIADQLRG